MIPHRAAIALGSNLPSSFGLPADNLLEAIARVRALGHILAVSSLRETDPVGYLEQPRFVNAVLLLETGLEPLALLRGLLRIELDMGRDRAGAPAKGPRIVDLDLILYDDLVLDTPELRLPHPAMRERAFVLEPLAEIAPEWRDPVTGRTVSELLHGLRRAGG